MEKPKNTNTLAGMQCPKCKSTEPFIIVLQCYTLMYDSGRDDSWGHKWDQDSHCECYKCGHAGIVKDFKGGS